MKMHFKQKIRTDYLNFGCELRQGSLDKLSLCYLTDLTLI